MKTLARRVVLVASVVLATSLAAEAANARSHPSHAARYTHGLSHAPRYTYGYQYPYGYQVPPPGYAYDAQANPNYGFGPIVKTQPTDVVSGNRIIGRDPDPFIRGQLLRAYDSGHPD